MANIYTKLPPAHNHDQVYVKIGEGGVTDHGALTGLEDNDHPQYLLTTGKAADSDKLDGIDSTGFATAGHDHNTAYLGITAKAADSDKLDGLNSTAFLQTSAWSSWTPTLVGWSSTTVVRCNYMKIGKILFFSAIISGTSNSTSTSFTLPENAMTEYSGTMGYCVNNGSVLTAAARYAISTGSNVCRAYTNMVSGAWTASGTKRVSVYGWIAID